MFGESQLSEISFLQPISRPLFNLILIHTPTQVFEKTSPLLIVTRQISISLRTATSICLKETRARRGFLATRDVAGDPGEPISTRSGRP